MERMGKIRGKKGTESKPKPLGRRMVYHQAPPRPKLLVKVLLKPTGEFSLESFPSSVIGEMEDPF